MNFQVTYIHLDKRCGSKKTLFQNMYGENIETKGIHILKYVEDIALEKEIIISGLTTFDFWEEELFLKNGYEKVEGLKD